MRGLGKFQRAQMKRGDSRVAELFVHLRCALEIMEQIALYPVREAPPPPAQQEPPKIDLSYPALPERITYSVNEVCKLMGISHATLYVLRARKGLPAIKVGKRTLVPKEALLEWLQSQPQSADWQCT